MCVPVEQVILSLLEVQLCRENYSLQVAQPSSPP
jgi:hypothetical protein